MTDYKALLAEILACHRSLDLYDDTELASTFTPATEQDIDHAESRLGCRLPNSYREFALTANGCPKLELAHGGLWPVDQIDWFRNLNPDWIDAYTKPAAGVEDITEDDHLAHPEDSVLFRHAYLPDLLQIGEPYDGAVYLLNPKVTTATGEWEAWSFANWYPGTCRKRSFRDLVVSARDNLKREVYLRSLEIDESAIMDKAIPALRAQIARGTAPSQAVIQYLDSESQTSDMFAAWMRTRQPYNALLKALGYRP